METYSKAQQLYKKPESIKKFFTTKVWLSSLLLHRVHVCSAVSHMTGLSFVSSDSTSYHPSKFISNAILSRCDWTANWTGKLFSINNLSALYLICEIPMVLLVQTRKHTGKAGITTGRQLMRSYPGQVLTCKNWLLPCILVILKL